MQQKLTTRRNRLPGVYAHILQAFGVPGTPMSYNNNLFGYLQHTYLKTYKYVLS